MRFTSAIAALTTVASVVAAHKHRKHSGKNKEDRAVDYVIFPKKVTASEARMACEAYFGTELANVTNENIDSIIQLLEDTHVNSAHFGKVSHRPQEGKRVKFEQAIGTITKVPLQSDSSISTVELAFRDLSQRSDKTLKLNVVCAAPKAVTQFVKEVSEPFTEVIELHQMMDNLREKTNQHPIGAVKVVSNAVHDLKLVMKNIKEAEHKAELAKLKEANEAAKKQAKFTKTLNKFQLEKLRAEEKQSEVRAKSSYDSSRTLRRKSTKLAEKIERLDSKIKELQRSESKN